MSTSAPFSSRTVTWLVGLSVASFLLAFVLAAVGGDLVNPRSAGPNGFSYSAIGHRAFVELLEATGLPARLRRSPVPPAAQTGTVHVLLEPTASALPDAVPGLPRVVVAAKWTGVVKPLRPGWLERVRLLDPAAVAAALPAGTGIVRDAEALSQPCELAGASFDVSLARPQWLVPAADLEPLVSCGGRLLVASRSSAEAPLIIVSDPDVLNNHGLALGQNASLVLSLLSALGSERVVVDETIHGFALRAGLVAELLRFPMVLVVIQGLVFVGLAFWAGTSPRGKPLPLAAGPPGGTFSLIDNGGHMLARGGHAGSNVRRYFDRTLRSVAAHYFIPHEATRAELVSRLGRIAKARGVRPEIRAMARRLPGISGERAVRLACELHRWRREMIDGAREDP